MNHWGKFKEGDLFVHAAFTCDLFKFVGIKGRYCIAEAVTSDYGPVELYAGHVCRLATPEEIAHFIAKKLNDGKESST